MTQLKRDQDLRLRTRMSTESGGTSSVAMTLYHLLERCCMLALTDKYIDEAVRRMLIVQALDHVPNYARLDIDTIKSFIGLEHPNYKSITFTGAAKWDKNMKIQHGLMTFAQAITIMQDWVKQDTGTEGSE